MGEESSKKLTSKYMGLTITTAKGERFTNEPTKNVDRLVFKNRAEWLKYVMNFLNQTCKENGTAKGPSALKDARFLFYKSNGNKFDKIEFDISTSDKDLNSLSEILWNL